MKQYKAQRKIGNPYSYLRSLVQDDLTILLGGKPVDISTAPGGGSNPPSGNTPGGGNSQVPSGGDDEPFL